MNKIFVILILLICIGGAFLYVRSDVSRGKNLTPPSGKAITESRVVIDCGAVFMQNYNNLELFGDGRVRNKSNRTKGEVVSAQMDIEKYKKLLLRAYEIDLFVLSKLKPVQPLHPDGGACDVTFVVNGKTTKISTTNLAGHPVELDEVSAYIAEWYKSSGINF